jgi:hypothetical protein
VCGRACDNVPCECTFTQHVELAPGATAVNVTATLTNNRSDHTDYGQPGGVGVRGRGGGGDSSCALWRDLGSHAQAGMRRS